MTMSQRNLDLICRGRVRSRFRVRFGERNDELAGCRASPVTRPDGMPDELAAAIDEVCRRRAPDPIELSGHLPGLVEQDRGDVATLLDSALDQPRVLPKADQQDLQPLALQFGVELVDGR